MQKYQIKIGLGRMGNHYPRTLIIESSSKAKAESMATAQYRSDLRQELGDDPIQSKYTTILESSSFGQIFNKGDTI